MKKVLYFLLILFLFVVGACEVNVDDRPEDNKQEEVQTYLYNDFTPSEKNSIKTLLNEVIPFISTNEYYVELVGETIHYYTIGNSYEDFSSYQSKLLDLGYSNVSGNATKGYIYEKGNIRIVINSYTLEDKFHIDINMELVSNTTQPEENEYEKTIAEFINLKDEYTYYILTGEVTEISNSKYGNLILKDESGSIFVYGVLPEKGSTDKENFLALEIEVGDTIKISGTYLYYNNSKHEVINAYLIDIVSKGSSSGEVEGGFTSSEKALFNEYFGFVLPFITAEEYYVEEYSLNHDDGSVEDGINFYTFGNSETEFNAYLDKIEGFNFTSDGTDVDEYGDKWYYYSKGKIYLDVSYYESEDGYVIDLYIYYISEGKEGGNQGNADSSDTVITNDGKGLPTDSDGVYDVDFTNAKYVKNITEQGYYLDGCPTTGDVKVLVIPVEFSDRTASSLGYEISKIDKAFNGKENDTDYFSVKDYYFMSSYEKLNLEFVVCDSWFRPENTSTYYASQTMEYYDEQTDIGDQMVMNEALAYLSTIMDLSGFDSDKNGFIDAVVMINTLEISEENFYWAYRYWNIYADDEGYYYEYDGISANDYLWASYQFLFEDEYGEFVDKTAMNTYTFIHEFGHILGIDDYYDTSYTNSPLDGHDVMDGEAGDHNPFSKFNLGWLTTSRLVVANDSVTLTLEDFSKNGDTIIIANNWDPELGTYQEYYVLMYYTNNGLNEGAGYFDETGIVMYHVNASLEVYEESGETYYDIYNSNTDASDEYGTVDNLIELCKSSSGSYVHTTGSSSSSNLVDDLGNTISYTFTVNSLTSDAATITIRKNN